MSDPAGGRWKPSAGGKTGDDYRYVPDAASASNAGHQRFIAFPGAETASSANGTMSGSGAWSATLTVPGARFASVDRAGNSVDVDCTRVTCGVITIGAHGIVNARNETFTPVRFVAGAGAQDEAPAAKATPATAAPATAAPASPQAPAARPAPAAKPAVAVDRATAVVGRVLTFTGTGFGPGEQVVATLDDGVAAVGPISAGASGEIAGVLQLPPDVAPGTHVLRLVGAASGATPQVTFAVAPATTTVAAAPVEATSPTPVQGIVLAAAAALLLIAIVTAVVRVRQARRRSRRPDDAAPAAVPDSPAGLDQARVRL